MEINEYQKDALRTSNINKPEKEKLIEGLIGMSSESGECLDILKKHMFQGHELDRDHLAKELGDVLWYIAITSNALGYDLETIFRMNIAKRKNRYPNGFSTTNSIRRGKEPGE